MDKKNTLLLTVIAIATLLVAVVGATFAFFTAQNQGNASTPVTVTTETTNSSTFDSDKAITITADMSNFALSDVGGERETGTYGEASPKVTLKSGSNADGADICYEISFIVDDAADKKFGYSTANTEPHKPELVLFAEKTPGSEADNGSTSTTEITNIDGLTYSASIKEEGNQDSVAADTTTEKGFDITEANGTTYKIPTLASQASEKSYTHKITVTGSNQTATDVWHFRVVMINYNFDQERNAGKSFTGKIQFTSVDCD